jgi:tetratricopeptide (TPR) repeat protein
MQAVHRVVRKASLRLFVRLFLQRLAVTTFVAVLAVLGARLGTWVAGMGLDVMATVAIAGASALAVAMVWALITRPRGVAVARAVDEAAGLRESLSTAWIYESQTDPWSAAVRTDADRRATAVDVRAALPVTLGQFWKAPPIAAAAVAIIWFVLPATSADIFGWLEKEEQQAKAQEEMVVAQVAIKVAEEIAQKVAERTGQPLEQFQPEQNPELQTPQAMRMAALDKLTQAEKALKEEVEKGEAAMKLDAMRRELSRMKQPGPGPAAELARELAKGDFQAAQKQLDELAQKIDSGELDEATRQQLAEQLKNMQAQLEQIAKDKSSLEQALQQAGMDQQQAQQLAQQIAQNANNPEQMQQMMQQAMQNMQNLTPAQQQQLMQQAQQMAQACQACQNMGQAMSQMAAACQNPGQGQGAGQASAGMLSQMEMMQMEQMAAQAMLAQTQSQMQSMCQGGALASLQGSKSGGGPMAGVGSNHATGEETAPVEVERQAQRTPTHLGQGPIVAERLVYGELVKGESVAQFSSAVQAASTGVAEAIEENVVPIEWQESLQAYFGRLQKRAEVVQGTAPAAPAETKPAGGN